MKPKFLIFGENLAAASALGVAAEGKKIRAKDVQGSNLGLIQDRAFDHAWSLQTKVRLPQVDKIIGD